jgi:hypothetical protein
MHASFLCYYIYIHLHCAYIWAAGPLGVVVWLTDEETSTRAHEELLKKKNESHEEVEHTRDAEEGFNEAEQVPCTRANPSLQEAKQNDMSGAEYSPETK